MSKYKGQLTGFPVEITAYQTSDGNTHKTKEEAEKVQKTINFENVILDLENLNKLSCETILKIINMCENIIENREKLHGLSK